jgi:hypothetical protein
LQEEIDLADRIKKQELSGFDKESQKQPTTIARRIRQSRIAIPKILSLKED